MNNSLQERTSTLLKESGETHQGVFLTGPDKIELLTVDLPPDVTSENDFVLASFGNCRCASDAKAIRQFDSHARVPSGVEKVALGHETLQMIIQAPADSDFSPGDIVVITPGHASEPIDPLSFEPKDTGVLAALGYSYQYLGGLRRFNAVPGVAPSFIRKQGFGNLFNLVEPKKDTSLISLAHAEPFACNFGTNKHIFTFNEKGEFIYLELHEWP
jgi:threonine dehydrogenase-like Zn-dependent dehydrogenase